MFGDIFISVGLTAFKKNTYLLVIKTGGVCLCPLACHGGSSRTCKVQSLEAALQLDAKAGGNGLYQGLPIEVRGRSSGSALLGGLTRTRLSPPVQKNRGC